METKRPPDPTPGSRVSLQISRTEDEKGTLTTTSSLTLQFTTASAQVTRTQTEAEIITRLHMAQKVSELQLGTSIIETLSSRLLTAFKTDDEKAFAEINTKIIEKPELLNQTDENNNISLFFIMLLATKGQKFLLGNLTVLNAVTATTLNAIIKNNPPFNGESPVLRLFSNPIGMQIVDQHPSLNKIIGEEALNSVATDEVKAGEIFNDTPILYAVRPAGRALLIKYPHMVAQFADGLFVPAMRNNQFDSCPVEELLGGDGELIRRFPHMFDKISADLLNNGIYGLGSLKGSYILSLFTGAPLGRTALLNSSALRSKITLLGLFNQNEEGPNKDRIPLHQLLDSDAGKKIIVLLLNENEFLCRQIHELLSDPIKSAPNPNLFNQVFSLPGLKISIGTASGRISPALFSGVVPHTLVSGSSPLASAPGPAATQQPPRPP